MKRQADGTMPWPHDLSPVDRVGLALADVVRARHHVSAAMDELVKAVERLMQAARGDHK